MHLMLTKNAAHKPRKKNEAFLNFNMKLLKIYTSQFPSRGSYLTVVKQQYHLKLRLRVVSTSKTDDLHFLEKLKRATVHINQLNVSCTLDLETRLERGHSEIHEEAVKPSAAILFTVHSLGTKPVMSLNDSITTTKLPLETTNGLKPECLYVLKSVLSPHWPVSYLDGRPAQSL